MPVVKPAVQIPNALFEKLTPDELAMIARVVEALTGYLTKRELAAMVEDFKLWAPRHIRKEPAFVGLVRSLELSPTGRRVRRAA